MSAKPAFAWSSPPFRGMGAEAIVNSELLSFSFPLTSDTPDIKGGTLASKGVNILH